MQSEIPVTSGKSNLFQYGGLLFHAGGTGFVGHYTVGHKKGANLFLSVTLSKINGF